MSYLNYQRMYVDNLTTRLVFSIGKLENL